MRRRSESKQEEEKSTTDQSKAAKSDVSRCDQSKHLREGNRCEDDGRSLCTLHRAIDCRRECMVLPRIPLVAEHRSDADTESSD